MIELKKEDIEKLDLLLDTISEHGFFGITWKGIEQKQPEIFNTVKEKDLIDSVYSDHKAREYERLASFFKKYDCGNVNKGTPFENGELTISKNHNTLQFREQGGFKNEFNKQKIKSLREIKQDKILDFDLTLREFETKIGKKIIVSGIIITVLNLLISVGVALFPSSVSEKSKESIQKDSLKLNKVELILKDSLN